MAGYRIVCTIRADHGHKHIEKVGTSVSGINREWTVVEVRGHIAGGDRFYTVSPSKGTEADVEVYVCPCGVATLRSISGQVTDNNLDSLRACNWARG